MAAKMQKDRIAGIEDVEPIAKAMTFVTEVTVIAVPAWDMVAPILSFKGLAISFSSKVSRH